MFEQITAISGVAGSMVALVVFVKGAIELLAMPRVNLRADYNFAHEFAQRSGDANAGSYAQELGFKALVNDASLSTEQRKAVLRLPNRIKTIPLYLKARHLLVVQEVGPVLSWRVSRHGIRAYRKFLIGLLFTLYLALALIGLPAVFGPYPKTKLMVLDGMLTLPLGASLFLVSLASLCMVRALTLATASALVKIAGTPVPVIDEDDLD